MGFTHLTHLAHMTCFMSYDWFLVCCAVDSEESADGSRTMTHYESWVRVMRSMSHAGLGLGEGPYIKEALGRLGVGFFTQPSKYFSYI